MTDDAVDDGRDETADERSDRNWSEILQELRAVQTGTQILSGFLLAVAFQPTFAELPVPERAFYLCLVSLAGAAALIGLIPVVLHRRLFRDRQKERLVRLGDRLLLAMLAIVSVLVAGVIGFVFGVTTDRAAGIVALGVSLVGVAVMWLAIPRRRSSKKARTS
ncbi:DUF6328 family protein [Microbacterium sp. SORGH_AS_0888]|uniref:DUF6328 family protein n=1 Tax=Microbacterium sp. SORGH_AS_0888 TaxID=3041791 RepID=UPI0027D77EA3|nr:DUF6328 family protein [Microbacterium sp. SORGH_AS_0888]